MHVILEASGDVLIQHKQLHALVHKARQMRVAERASLQLRWLAVTCRARRAAIEGAIARNDLSDLCYADLLTLSEVNGAVRISKACFEDLSDECFRYHDLMH